MTLETHPSPFTTSVSSASLRQLQTEGSACASTGGIQDERCILKATLKETQSGRLHAFCLAPTGDPEEEIQSVWIEARTTVTFNSREGKEQPGRAAELLHMKHSAEKQRTCQGAHS